MLSAMARSAVGIVPPALAPHIPVVARRSLSMPLSLLFDPDSFYLGVAAGHRRSRRSLRRAADTGRPGRAARADDDGLPGEPAHAGHVPRCRAVGIELGEHQRFTAPWLFAATARDDGRGRALRSVCRCDEAAAHRLRRRLFGRSHRTRRRAGRARATSTTSCSNAWPSGRSPSRSRPVPRIPGPASIRCSTSGCDAVLPEPAPARRPHHHEHGRGESAGGGRAHPRDSRERLGLRGLTVAVVTGDDVLALVTMAGSRRRRPARR